MGLERLVARRPRGWQGRSTVFATRGDRRCCGQIFSPDGLSPGSQFRNLLVFVHGDGRRFQYLLDALRPFARRAGLLLLAPLFPADLFGDGNTDGYKLLREGELRYDEILLDLVADLRDLYDFDDDRFLLGGFSGGGQFAHRFAYLHPQRLRAVSIAAPSAVTLLDEALPWWTGVADVEARLGRPVDFEGLQDLPVHLVVGEKDLAAAAGPDRSGDPRLAGPTRVARLAALHASLAARGVAARLAVVPDAGHVFPPLLPEIEAFFASILSPEPPAAPEDPAPVEPPSDA
jgi:poly(3-hydroxybutyrate) depolymerase